MGNPIENHAISSLDGIFGALLITATFKHSFPLTNHSGRQSTRLTNSMNASLYFFYYNLLYWLSVEFVTINDESIVQNVL